MSVTTEQVQKLFGVFFSRDEKGARIYSDQEIRDVLALLMIQGALQGNDIPSPMNGVLGDFAIRTGIDVTRTDESVDLAANISKYLKKNPLNPNLVKHVRALIQANL